MDRIETRVTSWSGHRLYGDEVPRYGAKGGTSPPLEQSANKRGASWKALDEESHSGKLLWYLRIAELGHSVSQVLHAVPILGNVLEASARYT